MATSLRTNFVVVTRVHCTLVIVRFLSPLLTVPREGCAMCDVRRGCGQSWIFLFMWVASSENVPAQNAQIQIILRKRNFPLHSYLLKYPNILLADREYPDQTAHPRRMKTSSLVIRTTEPHNSISEIKSCGLSRSLLLTYTFFFFFFLALSSFALHSHYNNCSWLPLASPNILKRFCVTSITCTNTFWSENWFIKTFTCTNFRINPKHWDIYTHYNTFPKI